MEISAKQKPVIKIMLYHSGTYLLWFGEGSIAGMFTISCSTYLSGRGGDWGTFFRLPPNAA